MQDNFYYINGCVFEAADYGDDGIKITMFDEDGPDYLAILMPPDKTTELISWLKKTIGKPKKYTRVEGGYHIGNKKSKSAGL